MCTTRKPKPVAASWHDTLVSIQLVVQYSSWFGDSLNACRLSAYELNKRLEKNRYTNIDPEEYYNKFDSKSLLGRKAYSAYDTTVPDSVRNAVDSDGYSTYSPHVAFPLDVKEFGEKRILRPYREHPEYFKNSDAFIDNIFKGVYLKSDYGDGTILYVDRVDMLLTFRMHYVNDTTGVKLLKKDGTDSLYYGSRIVFSSTKEVIQANQFMNSDKIKEKAAETEHTYIKSPAGIFTEATLPYEDISRDLANDTLNAVKLTFTNYRQESPYRFSMETPENVLLIRKKDLKTFFENNEVSDNITSYTVAHDNVATNQYTFSNITRLVNTCIDEKRAEKEKAQEEAGTAWDEAKWEEQFATKNPDWNKVLLIPVTVANDESSTTGSIVSIQNDLKPTYAKLRGGVEPLEIEVTYTHFGKQ